MHWGNLKAVPDPSLLFTQDKGFKVISRYSLGVAMCVIAINYTYCGDIIYINIKSLHCIPETKIIVSVKYI